MDAPVPLLSASTDMTDFKTISVILALLAAMTMRVAFCEAQEPGAESPVFREVEFQTTDGARIHANLYGRGEHAVVLAHGAVFNKESWDPLARELASAGLRVLAIDFRGYGKSTEGREAGALHLDVLGAMRYLRQSGARRISLLGGSMGGGAAAEAATRAKPGEVDRLILLAASPIDSPRKLQGNKLFIVSQGDGSADSVRRQYEQAGEPRKLVILPGDAHAQHIFKTSQSKALTTIIRQWLCEESPTQ